MTRRLGLIQIAVSACALAAAVWWGLGQHSPQLPHSAASCGWILTAIALYGAGTALRAERWFRILLLSDVKATRADAYWLTPVCYMGNNLLPARAGEMLRVFLLSRQTGDGMRKLFGTVLAERILDAAVLAVPLVVVVYGVLPARALPTDRPLLYMAGCIALLILGAIAVHFVGRHRVLVRIREFVRPLADAPRALVSPSGLSLIGMTSLIWAVEAAVYVTIGHGVGLDLSAVDAIYLVALANFVTALPAAPGSIGTFEAAVLFGLTTISAGRIAVSYLLVLRFVLYAPITLLGLVVVFVRYGGWRLLRERRGPVAPAPSRA